MMTAATSVAGASAARSWIGQKRADWLTPRRLRWITIGLFSVAILAAGTFSGTS